jgi:hypothetical protein
MVYDASRQRTVLFGGFETQSFAPSDTWEWDGTKWAAVPPAVASGRALHMMAYDRNREVTVLFGGVDPQGNTFKETLEYKGFTWTGQVLMGSPAPRWAGAMAFDAKHNEIVLFGGANANKLYDDTWVYDGVTWVERAPLHRPSPRANPTMTYDAARKVIVLFGGDSATKPTTYSGETWTWDGSDWTLMEPAVRPAPRSHVSLSFDPIRSRTVLFGGINGLGLFADTWEWDGASWVLIAPTMPGPAASYGNPLVFDLVRRRSFLYQSWTMVGFPAPITTGDESDLGVLRARHALLAALRVRLDRVRRRPLLRRRVRHLRRVQPRHDPWPLRPGAQRERPRHVHGQQRLRRQRPVREPVRARYSSRASARESLSLTISASSVSSGPPAAAMVWVGSTAATTAFWSSPS